MLLNDYVWFWLHHFPTPRYFLHLSKKLLPANVINLHMEEKQSLISFKGTVTHFCACAATWFLFRRTVFQDWRLVKKSSSIDPEMPKKAIISVFKSYLVHLGSFKRHILYFCASIVEKIRSHWGEPYEAKFVVVSVPTNGSNVAFNVVIWLSFLSIKVLQSTIYLWRIFFKR